MILRAEESSKGSVHDIPADLAAPPVLNGEPEPGKRVRATTDAWKKTSVYHAIYLPDNWTKNEKYPVIVEYPGNGGFRRGLDISHGTVEGCVLGYGLTSGKGAIWISLPFVDVLPDGSKQNCTNWWGDIEETKRYCMATVREVCECYGGDTDRVILSGFSRGAIACFYIGLHDDEIAPIWRAFFCHSHFDGVRENWPYPGADRASALIRLKRLNGRAVWISHEGSSEAFQYLQKTEISGDYTIEILPFSDHTSAWILRDLPLRQKARSWWTNVIR